MEYLKFEVKGNITHGILFMKYTLGLYTIYSIPVVTSIFLTNGILFFAVCFSKQKYLPNWIISNYIVIRMYVALSLYWNPDWNAFI